MTADDKKKAQTLMQYPTCPIFPFDYKIKQNKRMSICNPARSLLPSWSLSASLSSTNALLSCYVSSASSKSPVNARSSSTLLRVASAETTSISDMQRGIGGRIEDAFEAAKERGEAAFVTFVTAGYPSQQGE